jgi:hypothetical protein
MDMTSLVRRDKLSNLRASPHRLHHPLVQTFPVCSVRHGRYEDITKVDCTLTEPSHMIEGQGALPSKAPEQSMQHLRQQVIRSSKIEGRVHDLLQRKPIKNGEQESRENSWIKKCLSPYPAVGELPEG